MDDIKRYNGEGVEMIEVGRYMIDTNKDHERFFNVVRENIKRNDNVITDYASMLDSILTLAYKFNNGQSHEESIVDLEWEMVETYFGQTLPQPILDEIKRCLMAILDYYIHVLIGLGISSNRILFINNADRRGILIGEYNIEHLAERK